MAPLQRVNKCQPLEAAGPTDNIDDHVNHGTVLASYPHLKPTMAYEALMNVVGGRPTERLGLKGGFTHGVTTFAGGIPRDIANPTQNENRGIVLFTSYSIKPDLSEVPLTKPGAPSERLGRTALFRSRARRPLRDVPVDLSEPNRGTVLCTCPHVKPTMAYEARTNVAGGRPTERLGTRGCFTPGVRIFAGGAPRDVPVSAEPDHGTVLFESATLRPDLSQELHVKPGTDGERQGRCGSFEHGDAHLRMPTAAEAALWLEAGQKGGRRWGPGHFLAGTSILAGSVPAYAA